VDPTIDVFNRDVQKHGGYLYTTNTRLSSQFATQRSTDVVLEMGRMAGRSVLDIACGDGFYVLRFWERGKPLKMVGVDLAGMAVQLAHASKHDRLIDYAISNSHHLPFPNNSFDLVLIQSVLHHDENPTATIGEAFRVAPEILVHEPNGNNLGLKIIEKTSRYHLEHNEKSYASLQLRQWVKRAGGEVTREKFAGFVPMFSPDWLAKSMKLVEPLIESSSIAGALCCAVYVLVAHRLR